MVNGRSKNFSTSYFKPDQIPAKYEETTTSQVGGPLTSVTASLSLSIDQQIGEMMVVPWTFLNLLIEPSGRLT